MITASDVAKLRAATGAGMMDCKKALEEANGDMEKATEILRKKGIVKAAKRTDRVAAEGMTVVKEKDDVAVVAEVNSETDFVAQNENFKKLVDEIADHLLANKPTILEAALAMPVDGGTLQEKLNNATATIGEKIGLRRFAVVEKDSDQTFGAYSHMGGKISVLLLLSGTTDSALARDIAMHTAAANPKYVSRDRVPADVIAKEKEIYAEQLRQQGKPENVIENILKGKIDKFYSEICLLEQPHIKDEDKTVQQVLGGAKVEALYRYELGEGMEKQEKNFADEVAEQMG